MKFSIRIACENQARVINFESELKGIMHLCAIFRSVVKDNYSIDIAPYCKKHRGKAISLDEALQKASELRFFKTDTVVEYEDTEYFEELFNICLPYCFVTRDTVDWGTFFKFVPSPNVDIKPDMSKIAIAFEKAGLDIHLATSGSYYTHNKIKFKLVKAGSPMWAVLKINTHREIKHVHKTVVL